MATRAGRRPPDLALLRHEPVPCDPPADAGPDFLGRLHESLLARDERRGRGAFYTPPAVADELVRIAVDGLRDPVVCDPACGGGAFLLAAARHGVGRLVGIDVDPLAVEVAEAALWLAGARAELVVADALTSPWPVTPDVVVGNPPFVGPVDRRGTKGYVDDAVRFLGVAAERARRRVVLLQPESVVAAASAAAVRRELAPLVSQVWMPSRDVFADAAVDVVAVVLDRVDGGVVSDDRWAPLVAKARRVPVVDIDGDAVLGDRCTVVAGFRDEYYGLAPFVRERDGAPLVTSGLIDVGRCLWGERPARYGRLRWDAPTVDVDAAPAWVHRLLAPKVVVATQTRVVEAAADPDGAWVPCTPVISVLPVDLDLWHVLAVLLAPPVSAWALQEAAGAALSSDAIKLSASQVRRIPLPAPGAAWDDAAAALEAGDVLTAAEAMGRAYGVDVFDWWRGRLP